jgi:putative sigma-54 modulation protein
MPDLSFKGVCRAGEKEVIIMKIIVTGKNITISEKIQDAIDKRFEKLGKFFADDIQANIVIHPERDKVKMEATIVTKGTIFRAEDVSQDVFDSIDIVADKLSSQMTKYKGKLQKRNKSGESVRFEMIPEPEEDQPDEAKIVKSKKFQLVPISVDEAVMQMELLQHNFFVFLDQESDSVSVVYKRNDGNYGVVETTY